MDAAQEYSVSWMEWRSPLDDQFQDIQSVQDFQEKVPLRTYEDFWKDYWQEPFPHLRNCTWPDEVSYFCVVEIEFLE